MLLPLALVSPGSSLLNFLGGLRFLLVAPGCRLFVPLVRVVGGEDSVRRVVHFHQFFRSDLSFLDRTEWARHDQLFINRDIIFFQRFQVSFEALLGDAQVRRSFQMGDAFSPLID